MNHNEKINFNGKDLTIGDLYKKSNKEIVIGLYVKTHDLESTTKGLCKKIDDINEEMNNQWAKIGKNRGTINWIKGVLFVSVPIILYIVYNIAIIR